MSWHPPDGHNAGRGDLDASGLEAAILRATEALHRERWPNESNEYDPARDDECRSIIEAALRAAVGP